MKIDDLTLHDLLVDVAGQGVKASRPTVRQYAKHTGLPERRIDHLSRHARRHDADGFLRIIEAFDLLTREESPLPMELRATLQTHYRAWLRKGAPYAGDK